jgi:heme-degrading monooxygenase HmoA
MNKTMRITKLKLNDENLLEDWKVLSKKINADLAGFDGFISRDSMRGEDGLIYCILKWESKEHQEKFQKYTLSRTDEAFQEMFAELGRIMNMENMSREFLEIL